MKKILLIAITAITFTACEKKPGTMYKFCYQTPSDHFTIATNFFPMMSDVPNDTASALAWYKGTPAWKDISTRCDTFWVEYWGTWDEWKESEKQGWSI